MKRYLIPLVALLLTGCSVVTLPPIEVTRIVEVVVTATPTAPPPATPAGTEGWYAVNVMRVKILAVEDHGETITLGANGFVEETEGRFVQVTLRAENTGKRPVNLGWDMPVALLDAQDRVFDEMQYGYMYDGLCRSTRVNPGLAEECIYVFDVALDATGLRFDAEMDGGLAEISIDPVPGGGTN